MTATRKAAKARTYDGFTEDERGAMKARAEELKAESRRGSRPAPADAEGEVLAKIAELPEADRVMAERLHAVITASAPALTPRLWYGMPAYARNGKIVCHFQPARKFKTRYAVLGFSDEARLDDGTMWPAAYALTGLTADDEARIADLVRRAVG